MASLLFRVWQECYSTYKPYICTFLQNRSESDLIGDKKETFTLQFTPVAWLKAVFSVNEN